MDKLGESCRSTINLNSSETQLLLSEVDRAFKMFYLHMQMSGQLKQFKEDYFV